MRLASLRRQSPSAWAVVVYGLLVYGILAIGYHLLLEPMVKGSAVNKAIPEKIAVEYPAPPAVFPSKLPSHPPKQSVSAMVPAAGAASDAAETPTKLATRPIGRRERPRRNSAWRPFNDFPPGF